MRPTASTDHSRQLVRTGLALAYLAGMRETCRGLIASDATLPEPTVSLLAGQVLDLDNHQVFQQMAGLLAGHFSVAEKLLMEGVARLQFAAAIATPNTEDLPIAEFVASLAEELERHA